jgi:hypothetical protein
MTSSEKIEKLLIHLNISAKVFSERLGYDRPQIVYDIQKGKTKNISKELANKIISVFPEVNKTWLLADEGEMLRDSYTQTASESKNFTQTGDVNINNNDTALVKAIDEISAQRRLVEKSQQLVEKAQEQIDRLIGLLEHK